MLFETVACRNVEDVEGEEIERITWSSPLDPILPLVALEVS
jgi:hypothetical protein